MLRPIGRKKEERLKGRGDQRGGSEAQGGKKERRRRRSYSGMHIRPRYTLIYVIFPAFHRYTNTTVRE
jgi:hypothetical protein